MALQHLRSSTAHKRPIPAVMSAGQIAINTNEASPGLFFKDSNGDLVKVGPVHIGPTAPNSSPASVAATALVTGTVYQILTVGTSDFTLVGASANTVGTIFTATGTTTGTGTVSGQQGVEKGEQWFDNSGGTYVLKIYDGTAWRSESGTFVDVNGDTMTGALLLDNAASAAAPDLSFDGDADTGIYSPGANQFAVSTAGTGRLFIDSNGNVGIGVSSITNVANRSQLVIGGTDGGLIDLSHGSTAAEGRIFVNNGELALRAAESDGEIKFETGGANERFRIDSSGRVLTGTSSARTDLIAGTRGGRVQIEEASSSAGTAIDNSSLCLTMGHDTSVGSANIFFTRTKSNSLGGVTIVAENDILGGLYFQGTDGTDAVSAALIKAEVDGTPGANDMPGRIVLATTADGASSPTERLRITSSGQIQVSSAGTAAAPSVSIGTSDNGIYSPGTDQVAISTNGTGRLFIDASGNVGVGTTAPTANLEVSGGTNAGVVKIGSTANTQYGQLRLNSEQQFIIGYGSSHSTQPDELSVKNNIGPISFYTNVTERLRITSAGLVGIGTSSPSATLDVNGSASFAGGTVTINGDLLSHGTGNKSITLRRDTARIIVSTDNSTAPVFLGQYNQSTTSYINGDGSAVFDGPVGVGTTNPGTRFHVEETGTSGTNVAIQRITTASGGSFNVRCSDLSSAAPDWEIFTGNSEEIVFSPSSSEAARLDGSGRLLVGTSTASTQRDDAPVQIETAGNGNALNIRARSSDDRYAYINLQDSAGSETAASIHLDRSATNAGILAFSTTPSGSSSPTERMRIANDGKLTAQGVYNFTTADAANIRVTSSGDIVRSTSSLKYKTDVETLENTYADAIINCRPVWFRSLSATDNPSWGYWGFIAEEVAEIDPRLVSWKTTKTTYDENGSAVQTACDPEPEGVQYDRFVPHLLNLIKRQKEQIEAMEARLSALEAQ